VSAARAALVDAAVDDDGGGLVGHRDLDLEFQQAARDVEEKRRIDVAGQRQLGRRAHVEDDRFWLRLQLRQQAGGVELRHPLVRRVDGMLRGLGDRDGFGRGRDDGGEVLRLRHGAQQQRGGEQGVQKTAELHVDLLFLIAI
jgi:hypothetical protein